MGSVLFCASMCQTKVCFLLTWSVCSSNCCCCSEQLSSCIVSSWDLRDMGWKGSLEAIWSSLCVQVQDCCQHYLGSTLTFFSSALENLHVTPQPLWADDICITLQVIFFFSNNSLCPFFTILLSFALSAHLQFASLPRVLRKIVSSLCPDTDPCDIHLLFFVKWILGT